MPNNHPRLCAFRPPSHNAVGLSQPTAAIPSIAAAPTTNGESAFLARFDPDGGVAAPRLPIAQLVADGGVGDTRESSVVINSCVHQKF